MENRTERRCRKCYRMHKLEYQVQRNGTKHLVYRCTNTKKKYLHATEYLTFIENLPIESYFTTDREEKSINPNWEPEEKRQINQDSLF